VHLSTFLPPGSKIALVLLLAALGACSVAPTRSVEPRRGEPSYLQFHTQPFAAVSSLYSEALTISTGELAPIFDRCNQLVASDEVYQSLLSTLQLIDETEGVATYEEIHDWNRTGEQLGLAFTAHLSELQCTQIKASLITHEAALRQLLKARQSQFVASAKLPAGHRALAAAIENSSALLVTADLCQLPADFVAPFQAIVSMQAQQVVASGQASRREIALWHASGAMLANEQYGPMGADACRQLTQVMQRARGDIQALLGPAGAK
jgi:hypothetical protein